MVLLQPILLSCCLSSSLLLHQWTQIKGLARRLPPPVPKDQKKNEEMDIKKRNILVVLINSNNQILCNNEFIDIKQLREKVRNFIENPYNDEHMPEKTEVDVPSSESKW